jgi:hypothetical protein
MSMAIPLTDQQRQALEAQQGAPVEMVDPVTNQVYFLVGEETFGRVRELLEQHPGRESAEATSEIPLGILRSQQTFWRDLPGLLRQKKYHGYWAAYHREEQIGTAPTKTELIREILRRHIPKDDYYIGRVRPQTMAPWETEEVGPIHSHHLKDFPPET